MAHRSYRRQIEIRSYDWLTGELGRRLTNLFYIQDCGAVRDLTEQQLNQLANPFAQAMRFADWKDLCRKWQPPCHAVANQAAEILARRPVNEALFQRYRVLDAEAEKEFGPWSKCGFFGR